jgi:4-amino-4-deoxy-L-arabinose transferase-like glycosyltransferase
MNRPLFEKPGRRLLLAGLVLLAIFYSLGSVPLFDEDEGAYAQVTMEMLRSGDWVVPHLGGEPFFHKPPVIYWTQAISVAMLGPTEFAFRLPSALAFLGWSLLLFFFVRRQMNQETAAFTVVFLVSSIQINIISRAAIADAWLNLFITMTMFAIYAHSKKPHLKYILAAFAGMALGFMTKGPIAVLIPLVVSFLFFLSRKQIKTWIKGVCHPLGWVVFLAIALPWYLVLVHRFGWHFVEEIFMVHNFGRFRQAMEGHSGPLVYYIPVILLGLMPFTTVLVRTVTQIKNQVSAPWMRFLWLWFGFVFVFFSIADTKLWHYIVYGYVPLLILMAHNLDRIKNPWWLVLPSVLFLLPLLFLKSIAIAAMPRITDRFAHLVLQGALDVMGVSHQIIVGIVLMAVLVTAAIPRLSIQLRTLLMGCILLAFTNMHLVPLAAGIMQTPVKEAALLAKARHYKVIMWQMNYPSFHVYYGKPAGRKKRLAPGDIIVTKAHKLEKFISHEVIYSKHGIALARIKPSS